MSLSCNHSYCPFFNQLGLLQWQAMLLLKQDRYIAPTNTNGWCVKIIASNLPLVTVPVRVIAPALYPLLSKDIGI